MAIIGSSKSTGLYERLSQNDSTYRNIEYPKGEGPILKGYLASYRLEETQEKIWDTKISPKRNAYAVLGDNLNEGIKARINDTARIAQLIAKPAGIKWEAHQLELQTIQGRLEEKRKDIHVSENFGKKLLSAITELGKGALNAIGHTAETLEQVALAGTGVHLTPYIRRGYLIQNPDIGGNVGTDLLGTLGWGDGIHTDAGQKALHGERIRAYASSDRLKNNESSSKFEDIDRMKSFQEYQDNAEMNLGKHSKISSPRANLYPVTKLSASQSVSDSRFYDESNRNIGTESKLAKGILSTEDVVLSRRTSGDKELVTHQSSSNSVFHSGQFSSTLREIIQNQHSDANPYLDGGKKSGIVYEKLSGGVGHQSVDLDESSLINFTIQPFKSEIGGEVVRLQANLDSYTDNFTGDWSDVSYIGRADKGRVYTGFDRNISMGFKVVAWKKDDIQKIYNKLNTIAGLTAPIYNEQEIFMQGVFAKVNLGDLLKDQMGIVKSVSLSLEMDTPWELEEGKVVPHMLSVTLSFVPIYSYIPNADSKFFLVEN